MKDMETIVADWLLKSPPLKAGLGVVFDLLSSTYDSLRQGLTGAAWKQLGVPHRLSRLLMNVNLVSKEV